MRTRRDLSLLNRVFFNGVFVPERILSALLLCGLGAAAATAPQVAAAAGFELLEQSGTGAGQAYSGVSTGFGDGSEVFFNPASMSSLGRNTASAHINLIMPHGEFSDTNSRYQTQAGSIPLVGNEGGDAGSLEVVPNVYATWKTTEDLTLGLGINSPYGLRSSYNETWVGRYHAVNSELLTININPAAAYKVNDMISVGAGMQIMYADAKLSNQIDFGTIGAATLGLPAASQLGLLPQQADGTAQVEGDDWGVGFNLGTMVKPTEDLTFGIAWRSKIDMTLEGDADFEVPQNAQILTSTGLFQDSDAQADVRLPHSILFGTAYEISDEWTWYADATWTKWDDFRELRVRFDSAQPDSVQPEEWNNTWRFSTGLRYVPCDNWTFRAGFTYDESPVPSAELRTPRIPDNDRYWAAIGASYGIDKDTSISLSYAHIFIPNSSTELVNETGAILEGTWDSSVEIASIALTHRFDL